MKRIATTLLVAGLMATPMLALPPPASAGISVGISIGIAPPALPVYAQPIAPGAGYIWTPGYWAWNGAGYYWVPGTWVMPPAIGLLWTPGWWGWSGGFYRWNPGYWGRHVGFYGGINYGFGYFGAGYVGGYWRGHDFFYNRAVNNVNVTNIRNVYVNRTVINNVNVNRASFNGGRGGVAVSPTAEQRQFDSQRRWSATSMQTRQRDVALRNPAQRFEANHGRPAVYATQHAGRFNGPHAVRTAGVVQPRMATPDRGRGMVSAPHDRMQPATNRDRGFVEAPRNRAPATPANARPYRESESRPTRGEAGRGNAYAPPREAQAPFAGNRGHAERGQPAHGKPQPHHAASHEDREHDHRH